MKKLKIGKRAKADVKAGIGTKDDAGKIDVTLLDPEFLENTSRVMMVGAIKYERGNWQKSLAPIRILGALIRHAYRILRGEWIDKESGLPHTAHIACNAMFLDFYRRKGIPIGSEHDKG